MSWNPLRKIAGKSVSVPNEGDDNILVHIGGLPGVIQADEFDKISQRAANVDNWIKRVHKTSKRINETIINMSRLECKLGEDLASTSLCQTYYPEFRELIQDWHNFNYQMKEFGDNLAVAIINIIIEPTKKYQTIITEILHLLKKHEQNWANLNKLNNKQQLLMKKEKTGSVFVQLETNKGQISKIEEDLRNQSKIISEQVSVLMDCRIKYFQPCLEGLIKSECLYWGDSFNTFNSHSQITASQVSWKSWNDYSTKQADLLSSISALSIVEGSD